MPFPSTSRFGDASCLPDLKTLHYEKDGKQMLFNNQANYINHNPFIAPQQKSKTNTPLDFFHLQNKITITDIPITDSIPFFQLCDVPKQDPISFVEEVQELGKKYGAVKVIVPENSENTFKSNFQINSDSFWFQANKLLINPKRNELESRLKFHQELTKFHSDSVKEEPVDCEQIPPSDHSGNTEAKKKTATGNNMLLKLPMIDKRPLDLYKLFRCVLIRGGYMEVVNKKLWAQIGRELGYKGKIMTSLSSSLKASYMKILYPFELHIGENRHALARLAGLDTNDLMKQPDIDENSQAKLSVEDQEKTRLETMRSEKVITTEEQDRPTAAPISERRSELNEVSESSKDANLSMDSQKRALPDEFINNSEEKKKKLQPPPLIIGSSKEFRRSIKSKFSKGILLNSPHLIDCKQPNIFSPKPDDTLPVEVGKKRRKQSKELTFCPITPSTQVYHSLHTLFTGSSFLEDDSKLSLNGKHASVYNLRQFMEKDLKFQEYIIQKNTMHFDKISGSKEKFFYQFNDHNFSVMEKNMISIDTFEHLYWKFVNNSNSSDEIAFNGIELESGVGIPSLVNGSGFTRLGDDFSNYKSQLNSHALHATQTGSMSPPQASRDASPSALESSYAETKDQLTNGIASSLDPWNLHNIPTLPSSLLGALSENDLSSKHLVNPTLSIGMTFSTENWRCEDHFTQLCNYQFFGGFKKWYFIPESDFDKFEKLLVKVNSENEERVHKNSSKWDISRLMASIHQEEKSLIDYETLISALENMVDPYPDTTRLKHSNPLFQRMIQLQKDSHTINLNQDFLITPDMLKEAGINFTTTIQKPGEFILKFPKTYSLTISFGLNLSEEVNFATNQWLDYALEGEKWLVKQGITPAFSTFRMLVNIAQSYEGENSCKLYFKPEIYEHAAKLYSVLLQEELKSRSLIRSKFSYVRELVLDEKASSEIDFTSDDNLANVFPTKIILTELNSKQNFILSVKNYLSYLGFNADGSSKSNISISKEELKDYKVEMHLFYSDDRLKQFQKILHSYTVDYHSWMANFERVVNEGPHIPLKSYKSLLLKGEKIYSAVTSSDPKLIFEDIHGQTNKTSEATTLRSFKSNIDTLRDFVQDAEKFMEDCQSILATKYQQRIRGNSNVDIPTTSVDTLERLVRVVNKIPTLNFLCSESEQILEFKTEIENFDRACRNQISKKRNSNSLSELGDLITLGKSFGVNLPSLSFIIRIHERLKWIELSNVIFSGKDPNIDNNEVFTLDDLYEFKLKGLKLLSKNDAAILKKIDQILLSSEEYDKNLREFLEKAIFSKESLSEVDDWIKDFEIRNKASGNDRVFISKENIESLVELRANVQVIAELLDYNRLSDVSNSFSFKAAKTLLMEVENVTLKLEKDTLRTNIERCLGWMKELYQAFESVKFVSTILKKPNHPQGAIVQDDLSSNIMELSDLYNLKIETSFNIEEDNYFSSSSFGYLLEEKLLDECSVPVKVGHIQKYCICREPEFGTMIECDICHEWYHVKCVGFTGKLSENSDSYLCPMCKLVSNGCHPGIDVKFDFDAFKEFIHKCGHLNIFPSELLDKLKYLSKTISNKHEEINSSYKTIMEGKNEILKLDLYRFLLRKEIGSPIIDLNSVSSLSAKIHTLTSTFSSRTDADTADKSEAANVSLKPDLVIAKDVAEEPKQDSIRPDDIAALDSQPILSSSYNRESSVIPDSHATHHVNSGHITNAIDNNSDYQMDPNTMTLEKNLAVHLSEELEKLKGEEQHISGLHDLGPANETNSSIASKDMTQP